MHANARLTPIGRLTLCLRIESGRPVAHVAHEMGVSRPTGYKWWRRWNDEGLAGLSDRSSRPLHCPHRTPLEIEFQIAQLRQELKLGPARIGYRLGVPASTVHQVLSRMGLNRLAWMDRPTGRVIRRYERARSGELIHVDVKKLGRIPPGGGKWAHGQAATQAAKMRRGLIGFSYIHSAVDDHSRLAYSEVLPDEKKASSAGFWRRAEAFFASHDIQIQEVLTDNALTYKSHDFNDALGEAKHLFIRPYRPQTNGKVERFNRTLLDEWAYVRPYPSEEARTAALAEWLHLYNHHRCHTALGGLSPMSRVSNVPGHYT